MQTITYQQQEYRVYLEHGYIPEVYSVFKRANGEKMYLLTDIRKRDEVMEAYRQYLATVADDEFDCVQAEYDEMQAVYDDASGRK